MLTDVLGTIVAFITVILLLSVLVTGFVQASQAALGLRGRNLLLGVTRLIQNFDGASQRVSKLSKTEAKKQATEVLNDPSVALIYHVAEPTKGLGRAWRLLRGPGISWVDPDDLARVMAKQRKMDPQDPKGVVKVGQIKRAVSGMEDQLGKRFELEMRVVALVWALAVAIGFQVSAPRLLMELSQDTVRRERILAESKVLLDREIQTLAVLNSEEHLPDVIAELSKRVPKYAKQFEELSGVGTTKEFVLDELRLVLTDAPDREQIVNVYAELLDAAAEKRAKALAAQLSDTASTLAGFNIRFWRDSNFFNEGRKVHYDAILGVLLTAILLSFGAPFWFRTLRDVAALRDRLNPATKTATTETQTKVETKTKTKTANNDAPSSNGT